jgi:hypothetical protein
MVGLLEKLDFKVGTTSSRPGTGSFLSAKSAGRLGGSANWLEVA